MTRHHLTPSAEEAMARAQLLDEIARSQPDSVAWWNDSEHPMLGGRTVSQAWHDGDTDVVEALIDEWYAATARAIERLRRDPKRMAWLRQRIAEIDERSSREDRLHHSA